MAQLINPARSQAKLIILGDAGVGKTALAASLSGRDFNPESKITNGLDVTEFNSDVDILDFGGQQIFDSEVTGIDSGVAIVAVDARNGDPTNQLDQWLSMLADKKIQTYVVVTKSDLHVLNLDTHRIGEKYGVREFHTVSAMNGEGIQELRSELTHSFSQLFVV